MNVRLSALFYGAVLEKGRFYCSPENRTSSDKSNPNQYERDECENDFHDPNTLDSTNY